MKKLFFFATAALIMSACSNSGNKTQAVEPAAVQNEIVITNDMENAMGRIPGWLNENTVIAMKEPMAHSGDYASVTNDTSQYSYYYKEIVKNIKNEIPKMATFSGWVYTTVANPNFSIVCSINENNQQYNWKAFPLDAELKEPGKWVEFSTSFYFDDKPLRPDMDLGIYAWNQSKKTIYIDDLKVTFSY